MISSETPQVIFVTVDPPEVLEGQKAFVYYAFRVEVNHQLRGAVPAIYAKLVEQEKTTAQILCIHADAYGNLAEAGKPFIEKFKPDVIYCCYSREARRVRPDLPFAGWYAKSIYIWHTEGTRVVRLGEGSV